MQAWPTTRAQTDFGPPVRAPATAYFSGGAIVWMQP
jgi:hypothetical protein